MYRLEVNGIGFQPVQVVIAEEEDGRAFTRAETLVRRQFLTEIEIREFAIVEKKTLQAGAGYVIASADN